ncbi:MAG: LytTR family DNA-binding domain-containing protein [Ginsengibacter sp.]
MNPVNCIIIDDEPIARKGLREYINDVDFLQLSGEFGHPIKAASVLNEGHVQLIFLDIQMPKISGLELMKTLHNAPPVIFITAFPEHALESYDLNALDYLLKPVSFERFFRAALKAKEYYEIRQSNAEGTGQKEERPYFFIKADNKLVKIFFDEIIFVEALQNYVSIHTTNKKYISYLTFKSIQEYLPEDKFIKCHKSYIISAARISGIEGNDILMGDEHIPISRSSRDDVMEKLLKGKYLKR